MPRNPKKRSLVAISPNSKSSSSSSSSSSATSEPYPEHSPPTPQHCRSVRDALLALHGFPKQFANYRRKPQKESSHGDNGDDEDDKGDHVHVNATAVSETETEPETVLDGLISTLLSQNTTDANSTRAFLSLKSTFPTWQQVLDADPKMVEDAIRCGGLAATKAVRIRNILKTVREKRGEFSLEYLRKMSVAEVKAELSHFKGIGPKTVACVLMFQLQQEDFPVDTHVFRITKALGWVPMKADREKSYLHLNKRIPDELKFDLNCLLVTHGKICERCIKKRGGNLPTKDRHTSCPLEYVSVVSPEE